MAVVETQVSLPLKAVFTATFKPLRYFDLPLPIPWILRGRGGHFPGVHTACFRYVKESRTTFWRDATRTSPPGMEGVDAAEFTSGQRCSLGKKGCLPAATFPLRRRGL